MKNQQKSQTPAEGILLHRDFGDAKMYTITCECCTTDHNHQVWVEADETGVTVTTFTEQKTRWWDLNRWQIIWRLLTRGYVQYEASIIMTRQQALNYANVLNHAVVDVEVFRQQRQAKKDQKNKVATRLANEQDCV
jgi:hypothetical protein